MADQTEIKLADFIKSVHAELRDKLYLDSDVDTVWQLHCQNRDLLSEYAQTMRQLAETWSSGCPSQCRIRWCATAIKDYYLHGGLLKALEKESRMQQYVKNDGNVLSNVEHNINNFLTKEARVTILDVGSCFNPLKAFPEFSVLAIDIAPANKDVVCCDFLGVPVLSATTQANNLTQSCQNNVDASTRVMCDSGREITYLAASLFDVVVFSLFLEYLPSPHQRWRSCKKAHDVLVSNGLLVVITPDSHAVHRNASLMRAWKLTIEAIGFRRWRYEKLEHLHCMAFRKVACTTGEVTNIEQVLHIPQDFTQPKPTSNNSNGIVEERTYLENNILCNAFADLPGCFNE